MVIAIKLFILISYCITLGLTQQHQKTTQHHNATSQLCPSTDSCEETPIVEVSFLLIFTKLWSWYLLRVVSRVETFITKPLSLALLWMYVLWQIQAILTNLNMLTLFQSSPCGSPCGTCVSMIINGTLECRQCVKDHYYNKQIHDCASCEGSFTNNDPNYLFSCRDEIRKWVTSLFPYLDSNCQIVCPFVFTWNNISLPRNTVTLLTWVVMTPITLPWESLGERLCYILFFIILEITIQQIKLQLLKWILHPDLQLQWIVQFQFQLLKKAFKQPQTRKMCQIKISI